MRRTLLSVLIGLCLGIPCAAQTQPNIAAQILAQDPSVYFNFNDDGPIFRDQASGLNFTGAPALSIVGSIITPTLNNVGGVVSFNATPLVAGSLTSVSVQYHTAPSSGQSLTIVIGSAPSSDSITVESSFTVTLAATTSVQTFAAPADFTAVAVTAGEVLGTWASSSGNEPGYVESGGSGLYYLTSSTLPSGAQTYVYIAAYQYASDAIVATGISDTGIAARQPGFDPTQVNNTSVALTGAYLVSPSNMMGTYATGNPFSVFIHINDLQAGTATIGGSSALVIAAQDATSALPEFGWLLYYNSSGQFCYQLAWGGSANTWCTDLAGGNPTGYNYDIVVTDPNDEPNTSNGAMSLPTIYVNGTDPYQVRYETGGPAAATDGLTYIGGFNGGNTSTSTLDVDEFAILPGVADQFFVQSEFAQTKFYLTDINAIPADPPDVVIDEDGCTDPDNTAALNLAIKAHKLGYIRLHAVIDSDVEVASDQFFREILDSNGLANIPVAYAADSTDSSNPLDGNYCSYIGYAAQLAAYNSATAALTTYPEATPVLRSVIASLPAGRKLTILSGGSPASIAELMESGADSISSLTGAEMWADDVSEVLFQGIANIVSADSTYGAYIVANNGSVPLYFFDDASPSTCCTPSETGPGYVHTREIMDPLREIVDAGWNGEVRSGWDSLPTVNFLTGVFRGTCASGTLTITPGTSRSFDGPSDTAGSSSWSTATNSNHYACPITSLADPTNDPGPSQVYTWFINSLSNTVSEGYPRGD